MVSLCSSKSLHRDINYLYMYINLANILRLFFVWTDGSSDCDVCVLSNDCSLNDSLLTGWMNELSLTLHDDKVLTTKAFLTTNHISAALKLLKSQFPHQNGLEDSYS